MNGIIKALTAILGVLAVIACLATVGIIGYSMTGAGAKKNTEAVTNTAYDAQGQASTVPEQIPFQGEEVTQTPEPTKQTSDMSNHVHDYKEEIVKRATCYSAGQTKYTCECGAEYFVDIMSTGHVEDEWELVRKATADRDGLRVRKCIYCDEIIAQETIPYVVESTKTSDKDSDTDSEVQPAHFHQYTATVEREPSCVLAGLRKYTCSCGNFYTQMIPAKGHVATDWTVAEEPTATQKGTEQRTCTVCGVVLDSRPINATSPSASPASSASASASAATSTSPSTSSAPTASPSPTPHVHSYTSYVLKESNCTEKGVRSFVCTCGSSYAEEIELDLNKHSFRAIVVPATKNAQGYTIYTCTRCNYMYFDNYTPTIQ